MGKVLERWKHLGTTEYVCASCSKTFSVVTCFDTKKLKLGVRFCCKRCWYDYKSKNKITWNKGLKGVMKPNSGSFKKGEHRSISTEFKKGVLVGQKNNLWKGGVCPLNASIRTSTKYKEWRKSVFLRDDYTCQSCFKRGEKIHVNHKKTFASISKEFVSNYSQFSPYEDKQILLRLADSYAPFWDMENAETLCVGCHKKTPSYLKR